ncbi:MAG: hypothetical protein OXG11_14285 [Chloroflexi bacterium]|nr:hypothetical protein [Chloroflexota bacterium]
MISSGKIAARSLASLITHRFPVEKLDEALRAVEDRPDAVVKAVLEWQRQCDTRNVLSYRKYWKSDK